MLKYKEKFNYQNNPLMYVTTPLIDGSDTYYSATFMALCAEKWLAPFVENLFSDTDTPYEILGMLIQNKFSDTWNKIADTLQIEYNPLTDYRISATEQRGGSDTLTISSSNTVIEKVTSFDTTNDNFINDNKTANDTNSTNNSYTAQNMTTQKEGLIGRTPIQEYIRREIALRVDNNIKDIIIRNTISFITLPIY